MEKLFLLLAVIFACHVTRSSAIGPKCYTCDHVANPSDCDHYEQCSDGEMCFVQRFMGQQLNDFYKLGCMSNGVCSQKAFSLFGSFVGKRETSRSAHVHATETYHKKREEDLLLCLQCCAGDYCNVEGQLCGTVATTGLRCFECKDVVDPTHCEKITTCQPNHKCLLHVDYLPNAGDLRYEMRCEKDLVCTVLENTISSSSNHVSCAECCDDRPYCNFDLCKGVKASLNSNYTGSSGTSGGGVQPGTATMIVTQAPPFSVQIPGNHVSQPYKGLVTLQCQTSQTATKTWGFNGLKTLPAGVRVDPGTQDLHINSLDENTFGNYTCFAAPTSNPTSVQATTTTVSINPQAPVITSFKASPQQPGIHAQVNLTCKASGYPTNITFEWAFTKSGSTNPPPNVKYRDIPMGQVLEITLFETQYHEGTFTCTAKNSAGNSQPDTLVLQEMPQGDYSNGFFKDKKNNTKTKLDQKDEGKSDNLIAMDSLVRITGSYRERDKLIRLLQYLCKFVSGSSQTTLGKKLAVFAVELGSCRTVLRLFDDIPMLSHTLRYGLGAKETNQWLRGLELLGNFANQLFYPLEHVAWFAKHKLIDRDPKGWAAWCNYAWAISLLSEILKAVTRIILLRKARAKLMKEAGVEGNVRSEEGEMHSTIGNQIRSMKSQELHCYLTIIEQGTDLTNSVNWMAPGFLWSGTLSNRTAGLLGTVSSLIKIVRLHNPALVTGY